MKVKYGPGVQAVEMSYFRSACGVSRMDEMSIESVYECFGMSRGVVEEVKRQTSKRVWPHGANGGE